MFWEIILAIVPVFVMVAIGGICRALRVIDEASEKSLMQLVLLVLYPSFILTEVPGNQSLSSLSNVVWSLGCGAVLTLTGFAVAFLVSRIARIPSGPSIRTFCLAAAIQNYGFIPIPLIEALFPDNRSELLGVLFVHNLGLELVLWTLGVSVVSGKRKGALRNLINGPSIAIVVGLILNFTGLHQWIPSPALSAMKSLGSCAIPISLLLVGISLTGVLLAKKKGEAALDWRVGLSSIGVRFLVMPIFFLGTAALVAYLLSFPTLAMVITIEAAMPSAIFPIVISKHFGGRPSVAVQVAVATSIASLVLTPLLLTLGLSLLKFEL